MTKTQAIQEMLKGTVVKTVGSNIYRYFYNDMFLCIDNGCIRPFNPNDISRLATHINVQHDELPKHIRQQI